MRNFDGGHARLRVPARLLSFAKFSLITAIVLVMTPPSSQAIPAFSRQFKTPCATCHTHFPLLNEFGRAFLNNNFRMPGGEREAPLAFRQNIPLSLQVDAHASRDTGAERGSEMGLDAVILNAGGLLTHQDSFFLHHHLQEENRPGEVYEAWVQHAFPGR